MFDLHSIYKFARFTPLLDQPAQQNAYSNLEHEQHDQARREAEALFRPSRLSDSLGVVSMSESRDDDVCTV
jgi:hypothetical protein